MRLSDYETTRLLLSKNMVKECKKEVLRRPKRKPLSLKERKKGFATVKYRLLKQRAVQEAQRCLSLRECESCEICSLFCPDLCITRDEKTGEVRIDLDYCKGCGICAVVCPKGAIQMELEEGI
jgi:2-oxoacid:acceptor oxidoreductase delta subunit (pyruvate/2-ketoisovalerate family)